MKPRRPHAVVYDERVAGAYGMFGTGGGIQVPFVQAALSPDELGKISLVSDIEGSDRWPVRDLFQRNIDKERVEEGILPWLKNEETVKFFNPLTLALIPVDPTTHQVRPVVPHLTRGVHQDEQGVSWEHLEGPGLYRFRWRIKQANEPYEYAEVSWSSQAVLLVAIDGQHRLSALKRFLQDVEGPSQETFRRWNIPVVVTGLHRQTSHGKAALTTLDVVRNVFVYINTQAQAPTRARQILLDDYSVVNVCAQELLEYFHQNDAKPTALRNLSTPPLSLFDWRGETRRGQALRSPVALKTIVELADWLRHYILGEDLSSEQKHALGIKSSSPLANSWAAGHLRPGDHEKVRQYFRRNVLPGLSWLLKDFAPYRHYVSEVRTIESQAESGSDAQRHALSRLRFGSSHSGESEAIAINARYDDLIQDILDAKALLPSLILNDIGMRGVVCAFAMLRDSYMTSTGPPADAKWTRYAEWFVRHLNSMYADGWFTDKGHPLRQHITNTPAGIVINFKLDHAERALGAFTVLVVGAYAAGQGDVLNGEAFERLWTKYTRGTGSLQVTLHSGYRKRYSEELAETYPNWPSKRRKDEATALGHKATSAHLRRFRNKLRRQLSV